MPLGCHRLQRIPGPAGCRIGGVASPSERLLRGCSVQRQPTPGKGRQRLGRSGSACAVARLRLRAQIPCPARSATAVRIDPAAASETAFDGRIATPSCAACRTRRTEPPRRGGGCTTTTRRCSSRSRTGPRRWCSAESGAQTRARAPPAARPRHCAVGDRRAAPPRASVRWSPTSTGWWTATGLVTRRPGRGGGTFLPPPSADRARRPAATTPRPHPAPHHTPARHRRHRPGPGAGGRRRRDTVMIAPGGDQVKALASAGRAVSSAGPGRARGGVAGRGCGSAMPFGSTATLTRPARVVVDGVGAPGRIPCRRAAQGEARRVPRRPGLRAADLRPAQQHQRHLASARSGSTSIRRSVTPRSGPAGRRAEALVRSLRMLDCARKDADTSNVLGALRRVGTTRPPGIGQLRRAGASAT